MENRFRYKTASQAKRFIEKVLKGTASELEREIKQHKANIDTLRAMLRRPRGRPMVKNKG